MGETGRDKKLTDVEILKEISLHPDPVVTTSEIAERVEMTRQGLNNRMNELAETGDLVRKDVGGRAVIYWLSKQGKEKAGSQD